MTWLLLRPPGAFPPEAVGAAEPVATTAAPKTQLSPAAPRTQLSPPAPKTQPRPAAPSLTPQSAAEVATAPESPRKATTGLLQGLVGARALAYVARDTSLLDLAYVPGATKAGADRLNIATATKNGATYLGLAFVVRNAVFLDGTSGTARIKATILTPAYETGQPDGRRVAHAQEIVGPSVFTLTLTRDGWRILSLTGR